MNLKDIRLIKESALAHLDKQYGIPRDMGMYIVRDTLIKWAIQLARTDDNNTKKCNIPATSAK